MSMRNIIIAVLIVGTLAALYFRGESGVPVQVAEVRSSAIEAYVDEQGKTKLPETHKVTMPFNGRIQKIPLREGDQVTLGQVVAQISPADLSTEVAEARAAVERLQASIKENDDTSVENSALLQAEEFVKSMQSTVAAAIARQTSGKKRMTYAESVLARMQRLFGTGAATQDEVDLAGVQHIEREVDYRQDVLVSEAMSSMLVATKIMPRMISQYIQRKSLQTTVLEKQTAEAQARLDQALLRQQRGSMASPVAGVVLDRPIQNEQHLTAGTTLLTIGELAKLEVEAEVLSQDAVKIDVGDRVTIYGPAVGEPNGEDSQTFGSVTRISPAAFTKTSSLGVEQQRVRVTIGFAEGQLSPLLESGLGVDYRVRVRIITDAKPTTIVVPRSAIFRGEDNQWHVFAVRSGEATLQRIEVGLINDRYVEVTNGLSDHEQVIIAPDNSLTAGQAVSVTLN